MRTPSRNVAASVHARLLNEARSSGRPFNELLQYYAIERFLYRLSVSKHAERFILKGALMLRARGAAPERPTRDIDLLGSGDNSPSSLEAVVRDCLDVGVVDDGIGFDADSLTSEQIADEAAYQGVRLTMSGSLGTARLSILIDVGFGDAIVPGPIWIDYPEMLDYGKPRLKSYTLESAVAEKFEAMVALDIVNSRMKDFYDIWFMATTQSFKGDSLSQAVRETFQRRQTDIPVERPTALTTEFTADDLKLRQWSAFLRKSLLSDAPSLRQVSELIADFLMPPCHALNEGTTFNHVWTKDRWA